MFDINSIIETAKQVIIQPREFFEQMPKHGGYIEPIIFIGVIAAIAGIIGALFSIFSGGHFGGMAFGLGSIILVPIFAIIYSFIFPALLFGVWKLMGSREDYEAAFRCVAYAAVIFPAAAIFALIPYLGTLVATLWWFWLMFLASTSVHKLEKQKSMIVMGVIAAIVVFLNLSGEYGNRDVVSRTSEFQNQMGQIQNQYPG